MEASFPSVNSHHNARTINYSLVHSFASIHSSPDWNVPCSPRSSHCLCKRYLSGHVTAMAGALQASVNRQLSSRFSDLVWKEGFSGNICTMQYDYARNCYAIKSKIKIYLLILFSDFRYVNIYILMLLTLACSLGVLTPSDLAGSYFSKSRVATYRWNPFGELWKISASNKAVEVRVRGVQSGNAKIKTGTMCALSTGVQTPGNVVSLHPLASGWVSLHPQPYILAFLS